MIFKIILFAFLSTSFFIFYKRKLNALVKPIWVLPLSTILTAVSLAPMGWIIGLIGIYGLPKLLSKERHKTGSICAKCGTLSKKGDTYCRKCKNALT